MDPVVLLMESDCASNLGSSIGIGILVDAKAGGTLNCLRGDGLLIALGTTQHSMKGEEHGVVPQEAQNAQGRGE